MSEESKPTGLALIPWLPKSPYLNIALGVMVGGVLGIILVLVVLPRVSPTVEIRGIVTRVDENGVMRIGWAELETQGLSMPDNLQGYLIEFRATMLKWSLRGKKAENLFPLYNIVLTLH